MKAPDSGTYQLVVFWKLRMTAEAQILHLLEGGRHGCRMTCRMEHSHKREFYVPQDASSTCTEKHEARAVNMWSCVLTFITLSRSIGAAADGKNPFPSMAKQYSIVYTSSVWEKAAPLALILKPDHSVPLPVPGTFTPAAATLEHRASESIRKEERLQRQWLLLLCSDNLRTGRTDCAAEGATEHPSTEVRTPSKLANFCCAPFAQPHIFQLCLLSLWSRCLGSTSTTEAQVSFPRRCQWRHRPAEGSIEILMTCAQGVCVGKRNRRARTCSRH
ncbi:uncharacterized protein LOC141568564 isoform X2 [Rhinolophus sinicus]